MIQAVIMHYNGISTSIITKTLSKSKTTVVAYINKWRPALIKEFAKNHKDDLFLINHPPYSPELNLQENM